VVTTANPWFKGTTRTIQESLSSTIYSCLEKEARSRVRKESRSINQVRHWVGDVQHSWHEVLYSLKD
jgi:hypothetical protein